MISLCISITLGIAWDQIDKHCHVTVDVPACITEDESNCYWDASLRGNGKGRSFVDVDGQFYVWIK